jgi:hypothetical protein
MKLTHYTLLFHCSIPPLYALNWQAKNNGKSLQYRDQIDKAQGEEFYNLFVQSVTKLALEHFNNESVGGVGIAITKSSKKHKPALASTDKSVSPSQMFRLPPHGSHYSKWEETTGLPILDKDGNALTKSASKRAQKLYDAQAKRCAKHLEQAVVAPKEKNDTNNVAAVEETTTNFRAEKHAAGKSDNKKTPCLLLDPEYLKVVAGSFGKRQALEFSADMGPFCHVIDVE